MNNLLIFFAFPIAIIIISIILQKFLKNPVFVASLTFATFLIITFAVFDETFLIETLAYTILAFITSLLTKVFCFNNEAYNSINNTLGNNEDSNIENNCTRTDFSKSKNEFNYTYNRYRNF